MDGTSGLSAADLALINRDDNGFGGMGGSWMWLIALLFLFNGGFGGFGGYSRSGQPVTESGLCDAMNFNNLQNEVGRLSDQNVQQTSQIANGISQLGYDLQGQIASVDKGIALGNANLAQQMATCCCGIERGIDSVNYNGAINTAAINANTTAQTQKILDAITTNRMAEMQNQINQLQLQAAMCGVVRYPTAATYATQCNPFCGCTGCN